jgi:hypothetical protein
VSKHIFKRKFEEHDHEVEAESLPSGNACFTFRPPLPGRAAVITVDKETIQDLVRYSATGSDYDDDADAIVLSLHLVDKIAPTPDTPGYQTAVEVVPAEVFLDMVLDEILTECPNCGDLHFGDDVLAPDPDDKPKKTYLN